jgi:endonuclease YncB( thermonuclease family)
MAVRKKKSFKKKGRSATRFGLEILALCALLVVAAYVGNWGKSSQPSRPAVTKVEKKQEAKRPAAKATAELDKAEYRLANLADGDSFELEDAKKRKVKVRLYGVDAPEGKQPFGNVSRNNLRKLLEGKKLLIRTMYKDDYKRSVAIVYYSQNGKPDELSINQLQVQAGMAWVYDHFCTNSVCNTWKLEEAMAQKARLGLWRDDGPIPPWQWRRSNPR